MGVGFLQRHKTVFTTATVVATLSALVLFFQNCEGTFKVDEDKITREGVFTVPMVFIQNEIPSLTRERSIKIEVRTGQDRRLTLNQLTCRLYRDRNGISDEIDSRDCTSLAASYSDLADGNYRIEVEGIDSRNQRSDPAVASFVVDGTPPVVVINSAPASTTGSAANTFEFSATDNHSSIGNNRFECAFDAGQFAPCQSPVNVTRAQGTYSLRLRAVDEAGNASIAVNQAWRVDLTAPTLNFVVRPANATRSRTETIQFQGTDDGVALTNFMCRLNGGNFAACTSPAALSNLQEGPQVFEVRAVDGAGNLSESVSARWSIDLTAPTNPALTSSVTSPTTSLSVAFTFAASDGAGSGVARYLCSNDSATAAVCTSPVTRTVAGPGSYGFSVHAIDAVGNVGPATTFAWTVFPPPTPTPTPPPVPTPAPTPVPPPQSGNPIAYSIAFEDPTNSFGADRAGIESNLNAAMADWSRYLTGRTPIRILVRASPQSARFGGASRTTVFKGTVNGLNVFEDITTYKLRTGLDPSPTLPDVYIDVNIAFMRSNYFTDPNPSTRTTPVPVGKVDLVTVLAHELGHAFGMNGFLDRKTGAYPANNGISVYDSLMSGPMSGSPLFTGGLATFNYGANPPISYFASDSTLATFVVGGITYNANLGASQNFYHYGRYASQAESPKTMQGLMGGAWLFSNAQGLRIRVSDFDAAIMRDLGIPAR